MILLLKSHIDGVIEADEVHIGYGVYIEPGVHIKSKSVTIGDFAFIGRDVRVDVPLFRLGDYTKLHNSCFLHGYQPMQIGRNCWIGEHTILDSIGGLVIDDNVGIGAHSQVWTHAQHGDIVEGCRFHSSHPVYVGKDAWLVGHCITSMHHMAERSMALAGSVVTHDTEPNHVYAGVPAVDVTAKTGPQFAVRTTAEKREALNGLILAFEQRHPEFAGLISCFASNAEHVTFIDVSDRTYTQTFSEAEVTFLRENPLVRVTPADNPPFVSRS